MEPELYLKKHYIMTYIEDVTCLMLAQKKKDSKFQPLPFLQDYFQRVRTGSHVFRRKYSFISATPYNRRCFIKLIWQAFVNITRKKVPMKGSGYHQLIELVCADFPFEIINQVMLVLAHQEEFKMPERIAMFFEFLYAFQVLFYYKEFIQECKTAHSKLSLGNSSQTSPHIVVVPCSKEDDEGKEKILEDDKQLQLQESGVRPSSSSCSIEVFTQSIEALCCRLTDKQPWIVAPPFSVLKEILQCCPMEITFLDFLTQMCYSKLINDYIGILPVREVFVLTDPPIIGEVSQYQT